MVGRRRYAATGVALLLAGAVLPACSSSAKHTKAGGRAPAVTTTTSPFGKTPAGWLLTTTDPSLGGAPTFTGNGYLATRVPAQGTGYRTTPVETQSQVAGFYAQPPGTTEHRVSVPTW